MLSACSSHRAHSVSLPAAVLSTPSESDTASTQATHAEPHLDKPLNSDQALPSWKQLATQSTTAPPVYFTRITPPENEPYTVFLTVLRECGKSEQTSPATLMRQLFVGFSDILIRKKTTSQLNSTEIRQWDMQSRLEDSALFIKDFSTFSNGCTLDLVFWCQQSDELDANVQLAQNFFESQQEFFLSVAQNIIEDRAP